MEWKEESSLVYVVFILLFLGILLFLLAFIFIRRKNKLLLEKDELKKQLEREATESTIEIREEILRNISWELHDNIGQLVTLAKIQLQSANAEPAKIEETIGTIGTALSEIRSLSKSINPESLKDRDLISAIEMEIERFNRLKFIKSTLVKTGDPIDLCGKDEVILFRILQEFFSNTIRHSKATELNISVDYTNRKLSILACDNGKGFDKNHKREGIGLKNIEKRSELIGAKLSVKSEIDKGTTMKIDYTVVN